VGLLYIFRILYVKCSVGGRSEDVVSSCVFCYVRTTSTQKTKTRPQTRGQVVYMFRILYVKCSVGGRSEDVVSSCVFCWCLM
jgi:hypothetical protein